MELLSDLLAADPASPRLTVYDEVRSFRLDFSAQTLDNWAAKVANMLLEELDMEPGESLAAVELPVCWQTVAITLGCLAAGVQFSLNDEARAAEADVVFCGPDGVEIPTGGDVVAVSPHPYGRGVVEEGGSLPPGVVDFGPTVRFYGDVFPEPTPRLSALVPAGDIPAGARCLSTGWSTQEQLVERVLAPLAAGGSAVVVAGPASVERLEAIAEAEKATHDISAAGGASSSITARTEVE